MQITEVPISMNFFGGDFFSVNFVNWASETVFHPGPLSWKERETRVKIVLAFDIRRYFIYVRNFAYPSQSQTFVVYPEIQMSGIYP